MRRNLFCALSFALALAIQALAPAAADVAMGAAAQVCAAVSSGEPGLKAQPASHSDTAPALCDLCAMCCGAVAPIAPRPGAGVTMLQYWTVLVWAAADESSPVAHRGHSGQARAPPSVS